LKFLIIGYGSIGKRHARNAVALGHDAVLLRHTHGENNSEGYQEYYSFDELFKSDDVPDGAIVCSPTSSHLDNVKTLVQHGIPFLLEKPPTVDLESAKEMQNVLNVNGFRKYDIAYNLRYHPLLLFIKNILMEVGSIYSTKVYVGYYLPYWREGVDYRQTVSAKKELGGGVHVELAHEIDYLLWMLGTPKKITGYVNKVSRLEISSEDMCSAIFLFHNGSTAELHMDYLSHRYLRGGQIIAENGTLDWDLKSGIATYYDKGKQNTEEIFRLPSGYDLNDTYTKELNNFIEIIEGTSSPVVNINVALDTMKVLAAIETSAKNESWVYL
jgi:predicted dehydrogenase